METKAYSTLNLKMSKDGRTLIGIASTPTPDRDNDTLDPMGAIIKTPFPLLYQHDPERPIGNVTEAVKTPSGIHVIAEVADASLEYVKTAYEQIKAGLVKGFSIGFRGIEYEPNGLGGLHFSKYEIMELSAVTVPANAEATIQAIKCADKACKSRYNNDVDEQLLKMRILDAKLQALEVLRKATEALAK